MPLPVYTERCSKVHDNIFKLSPELPRLLPLIAGGRKLALATAPEHAELRNRA